MKCSFVFLLISFATISQTFMVYENAWHQGRRAIFALRKECSNVLSDWNDKITSVNTGGGCVMLCEHANCKGTCIFLSPGCGSGQGCCPEHGHLGRDGCDFNDRTSSFAPCNWVAPVDD